MVASIVVYFKFLFLTICDTNYIKHEIVVSVMEGGALKQLAIIIIAIFLLTFFVMIVMNATQGVNMP